MKQRIRFAKVGKNQIQKLLDLKIGRRFIEKEQIEEVKKILKLEEKSIINLRRTRNTIVRELTRDIEKEEDEEKWSTMSGVTAVIDDMIYRQGGMI